MMMSRWCLRDLINEALRQGLRDMSKKPAEKRQFPTRSVNMGRIKLASLDNIAEVLSVAEGDTFK